MEWNGVVLLWQRVHWAHSMHPTIRAIRRDSNGCVTAALALCPSTVVLYLNFLKQLCSRWFIYGHEIEYRKITSVYRSISSLARWINTCIFYGSIFYANAAQSMEGPRTAPLDSLRQKWAGEERWKKKRIDNEFLILNFGVRDAISV